MSYISEQEAGLKKKIISQCANADFAEFWQDQVSRMRSVPLKTERKRIPGPYDRYFLTDEITFNTHDATVIKAWFSYPALKAKEKLPCVAFFHGGGGRRSRPLDILATGVCVFAMDVRSQGGASPDQASYQIDYRGAIATRGALDPDNYYLKNIYLDAVRAMDVIAGLPEVDTAKIVTHGMSQGGALSIVASALSGHSSQCFASCPSYNCLRQRVENGSGIFYETKRFLTNDPQYTDQVMDTLSYFDVNNMISLVQVPFTVHLGLIDDICLPHFVYSVYHHANNPKKVWFAPFTKHVESRDYILYRDEQFAGLLDN